MPAASNYSFNSGGGVQTVGTNEIMRIAGSGSVGIGTSSPVYKLHISGTDTNLAGPHLYVTTSADSYPVYQQLNWGHDNISQNFDMYFDGAWRSSNSGSNFQIYKTNNRLSFNYASGVAAGSTVSYGTALAIQNNGYIGIGTTNPQSTLEIITSAASNRQVMINSFELGYDSAGYGRLQAWDSSAKPIIINPAGGNVGIGVGITAPSHILQINGQGRATNSAWATTSDIRLKDVQGPFEGYGLNEIKQIETIRFRYKKDNPLNLPWRENHIGVSAQQLQTLIPDAVELQSDGYLTVNTDPVFWTLVNSVKELAQENDQLKAESAQLKAGSVRKDADISQLKAESAQLKTKAEKAESGTAQLKNFICTQFPSAEICSK